MPSPETERLCNHHQNMTMPRMLAGVPGAPRGSTINTDGTRKSSTTYSDSTATASRRDWRSTTTATGASRIGTPYNGFPKRGTMNSALMPAPKASAVRSLGDIRRVGDGATTSVVQVEELAAALVHRRWQLRDLGLCVQALSPLTCLPPAAAADALHDERHAQRR